MYFKQKVPNVPFFERHVIDARLRQQLLVDCIVPTYTYFQSEITITTFFVFFIIFVELLRFIILMFTLCVCRTLDVNCTFVKEQLVDQIHLWHDASNCPGGAGEKCLYTVS